jgi:hypothetical protein
MNIFCVDLPMFSNGDVETSSRFGQVLNPQWLADAMASWTGLGKDRQSTRRKIQCVQFMELLCQVHSS